MSTPVTSPVSSRAVVLVLTALTAVLSAGGVLVLHRVFVMTVHGQAVDDAALLGAGVRLWRLEDGAYAVLDTVSALGVVAAVVAVAVVALVQRRLRLAMAAVVLVGGALATTQVAKHLLLERPDLGATYALENSLPSGHTTFAGAVAAAALLVAPVRLRPLVAVCGAGYTAAIGVGTLAAGWHRPSDAVAAMLVVLAWGAVAVPLAGGHRSAEHGSAGRAVAGVVLVTGAAVGLAGGVVGLVAVWLTVPPAPQGRLGQVVAGVGGALGVGGTACAALLVLLLLQRLADRAATRRAAAVSRHDGGAVGGPAQATWHPYGTEQAATGGTVLAPGSDRPTDLAS